MHCPQYPHSKLWSVLCSVLRKINLNSKLVYSTGARFLFCREFNTSGAKVLNSVLHPAVTQCHKINFKSAAFVAKFRTCGDETQLDSAEHNVLKPGSWTCGVDFGMSAKGVILTTFAAGKLHSDFTPSEQCALYSFTVNYAIKRFNLSLEMKRTFPFEYLVYANNRYVINRTIFLYLQFWFGILESYNIKQFMCLTTVVWN